VTSLTLGFTGGLTLTRRAPADEVDALRAALDADDRLWHELRTDQGTVSVFLPRLAFFELGDGERRLGFD